MCTKSSIGVVDAGCKFLWRRSVSLSWRQELGGTKLYALEFHSTGVPLGPFVARGMNVFPSLHSYAHKHIFAFWVGQRWPFAQRGALMWTLDTCRVKLLSSTQTQPHLYVCELLGEGHSLAMMTCIWYLHCLGASHNGEKDDSDLNCPGMNPTILTHIEMLQEKTSDACRTDKLYTLRLYIVGSSQEGLEVVGQCFYWCRCSHRKIWQSTTKYIDYIP